MIIPSISDVRHVTGSTNAMHYMQHCTTLTPSGDKLNIALKHAWWVSTARNRTCFAFKDLVMVVICSVQLGASLLLLSSVHHNFRNSSLDLHFTRLAIVHVSACNHTLEMQYGITSSAPRILTSPHLISSYIFRQFACCTVHTASMDRLHAF